MKTKSEIDENRVAMRSLAAMLVFTQAGRDIHILTTMPGPRFDNIYAATPASASDCPAIEQQLSTWTQSEVRVRYEASNRISLRFGVTRRDSDDLTMVANLVIHMLAANPALVNRIRELMYTAPPALRYRLQATEAIAPSPAPIGVSTAVQPVALPPVLDSETKQRVFTGLLMDTSWKVFRVSHLSCGRVAMTQLVPYAPTRPDPVLPIAFIPGLERMATVRKLYGRLLADMGWMYDAPSGFFDGFRTERWRKRGLKLATDLQNAVAGTGLATQRELDALGEWAADLFIYPLEGHDRKHPYHPEVLFRSDK